MRVLGVDTSTKSLGVAIVEDGNILMSMEKVFGLRHSQDLVPTIKELLRKICLKIEDMDGFAVSLGPGSFTGLRVGITAVKTLALVTKKPVIGVPTLDVIAQGAYYYPGIICPIMDAKKQKLYAALYKRGAKGLKRISGYLLISIDRLLHKINRKTLFIGDGITLYGEIIKKRKSQIVEFAPSRFWLPKVEHVTILGWERMKKGKKDVTLKLVPLYLHSKECNITR